MVPARARIRELGIRKGRRKSNITAWFVKNHRLIGCAYFTNHSSKNSLTKTKIAQIWLPV